VIHGMQEVWGSNPHSSTIFRFCVREKVTNVTHLDQVVPKATRLMVVQATGARPQSGFPAFLQLRKGAKSSPGRLRQLRTRGGALPAARRGVGM
jgi:hypothetical protein